MEIKSGEFGGVI